MTGMELFAGTGAAMTLGQALGGIGAIASAAGVYGQYQSQANASEYQSDLAKQQMKQEAQAGEEESRDYLLQQRRALGTRNALAAASGADLLTGSPYDAGIDMIQEIALQNERIKRGSAYRQSALQASSNLNRTAARNYRSAAPLAAGTTLLSGASEFG